MSMQGLLRKLEIGDSVLFFGGEIKKARAAAGQVSFLAPQYRFRTRAENNGVRIWRIEKNASSEQTPAHRIEKGIPVPISKEKERIISEELKEAGYVKDREEMRKLADNEKLDHEKLLEIM